MLSHLKKHMQCHTGQWSPYILAIFSSSWSVNWTFIPFEADSKMRWRQNSCHVPQVMQQIISWRQITRILVICLQLLWGEGGNTLTRKKHWGMQFVISSVRTGALYQYNNNINVTRLIRSLRFSILDGRHLDQIVKGTLEAILSVRW